MSDPLEQLYIEYKDSIYRFLFRTTRSSHRAEELTQETFIKAFKGIRQFRGDSSIKTWLFTIARNTYLNEVRKKSSQIESSVDVSDLPLPDKQNDYQAVEEQMLIQQVLSQMTDKERMFILLRDFQEFSYEEIAQILQLTEGQVKIGIYRARKKFKLLYREQEEGGTQ